jgi:hypothetical protein
MDSCKQFVNYGQETDRQSRPTRRRTDAPPNRRAAEPTDRKVLLLLNSKNRQLQTTF